MGVCVSEFHIDHEAQVWGLIVCTVYTCMWLLLTSCLSHPGSQDLCTNAQAHPTITHSLVCCRENDTYLETKMWYSANKKARFIRNKIIHTNLQHKMIVRINSTIIT